MEDLADACCCMAVKQGSMWIRLAKSKGNFIPALILAVQKGKDYIMPFKHDKAIKISIRHRFCQVVYCLQKGKERKLLGKHQHGLKNL